MATPTDDTNDELFLYCLRSIVSQELCVHQGWKYDGHVLECLTFHPIPPEDQDGLPVVPLVFRRPPLIRIAFPPTQEDRELILDYGVSEAAVDRVCAHIGEINPLTRPAKNVSIFAAPAKEVGENVTRVFGELRSAEPSVAGAASIELASDDLASRDAFIKVIVQIVMRALLLHPDVVHGLKVCLGTSHEKTIQCGYHAQYTDGQLSISLSLSFSLP